MKLFTFIVITLAISHCITAQPGAYKNVLPPEYETDEQTQDLPLLRADYVMKQSIQQGRTRGWLAIDTRELNINSELRGILNFGVQYVIEQGMRDKILSNSSDYYVEDVFSIESQVISGSSYRFNVRLENEENEYAHVLFVVDNQPWIGTREVTSYLFLDTNNLKDNERKAEENEDDVLSGKWFLIDVEKVNNDEKLQNILNFGLKYIIMEGIKNHELSNTNYSVDKISSIESLIANSMNYHRFDLDLVDQESEIIRAKFTVYDLPQQAIREVKSYYFFEGRDGEESDNEGIAD